MREDGASGPVERVLGVSSSGAPTRTMQPSADDHVGSSLNEAFEELQLQPPPLCHQRSGDRYGHRESIVSAADLDDLPPQPLPLCHQRSEGSNFQSLRSSHRDDDGPLGQQLPSLCHQRSFEQADYEDTSWISSHGSHDAEPSGWDDHPDEPLYRSVGPYFSSAAAHTSSYTSSFAMSSAASTSSCGESTRSGELEFLNRSFTSKSSWDEPTETFCPEHGFLHVSDPRLSQRVSSRECESTGSLPGVVRPPQMGFVFELPIDLFDTVLGFLPCHPGLFAAMATCRSWRDAARINYRARQRRVPATPDALLDAVAASTPGDTLFLEPGRHTLSTELVLEHPLRLLGVHSSAEGENSAASGDSAAVCASRGERCEAEGAAEGTACCGAVICSPQHVLLRTRCCSHLEGITLCRTGDEVGYPNTVAFAEVGKLTMDSCRITCCGDASVAEALRALDNAPTPGQPFGRDHETVSAQPTKAHLDVESDEAGAHDGEGSALGRPQTGIWVGAAASVFLRRNLIVGTAGPGIKIYRGELDAEENTIAFSGTGANVVANGGRVELRRNEIAGASGDGVSAWNGASMRIDSNRIHSNSGSGIAVNSAGGREMEITDNAVFNNSAAGLQFLKGQLPQAHVSRNAIEANGRDAQPAARGIGGGGALGAAPPMRRVRSADQAA